MGNFRYNGFFPSVAGRWRSKPVPANAFCRPVNNTKIGYEKAITFSSLYRINARFGMSLLNINPHQHNTGQF